MPINPIGSTPPTPPPQRKDLQHSNSFQTILEDVRNFYEVDDPQDAILLLSQLMSQVGASGGNPEQIANAMAALEKLQNLMQNGQPFDVIKQQYHIAKDDLAGL